MGPANFKRPHDFDLRCEMLKNSYSAQSEAPVTYVPNNSELD